MVSDCDAVGNIYGSHHYTFSIAAAAAVSLNAGTDLDCGSTYSSLTSALLYNLTTEATLDRSLNRLYSSLLQVGWFDKQFSQYSSLSWANVNTAEARDLAYQAAVEGCTLLKNDGVLPLLNLSSTIALIGPWANATTQMQGNYHGTAPYLVSPREAFQAQVSTVLYAEGTTINGNSTEGFASALVAATQSDYIIYLGGIDTSIEAEGMDRASIIWPGNQLDLIAELAGLAKPLIVVQFGGGQIDDSPLLANPNVRAILWAGYPGQEGGNAIFDILIGKASVAGRLPVTQYPSNYTSEVTMYQMSLRPNGSYPGRTYKWYDQMPVLPFGYGLHYTNFSLSWAAIPKSVYIIQDLLHQARGQYKDLAAFITVEVDVENIGGHANLASDYVGLLFLSTANGGAGPYPIKELVSYGRLHSILPNSSQRLSLPLTLGNLARTDTEGNSYLYPGTYKLAVDIDAKITVQFDLVGIPALIESLPKNPSNASAFEYLGCFSETSNGSIALYSSIWAKAINLGTSNYPQLCVDQCKQSGYYYSGLKKS